MDTQDPPGQTYQKIAPRRLPIPFSDYLFLQLEKPIRYRYFADYPHGIPGHPCIRRFSYDAYKGALYSPRLSVFNAVDVKN